MALTATITRQSYAVIRSSLGMLITYDVIESPHKPNIFYGIIPRMTIQQLVGKLGDGIRKRGINFPKTIIFCRRYIHMYLHVSFKSIDLYHDVTILVFYTLHL